MFHAKELLDFLKCIVFFKVGTVIKLTPGFAGVGEDRENMRSTLFHFSDRINFPWEMIFGNISTANQPLDRAMKDEMIAGLAITHTSKRFVKAELKGEWHRQYHCDMQFNRQRDEEKKREVIYFKDWFWAPQDVQDLIKLLRGNSAQNIESWLKSFAECNRLRKNAGWKMMTVLEVFVEAKKKTKVEPVHQTLFNLGMLPPIPKAKPEPKPAPAPKVVNKPVEQKPKTVHVEPMKEEKRYEFQTLKCLRGKKKPKAIKRLARQYENLFKSVAPIHFTQAV
jgi:hypothetical protein